MILVENTMLLWMGKTWSYKKFVKYKWLFHNCFYYLVFLHVYRLIYNLTIHLIYLSHFSLFVSCFSSWQRQHQAHVVQWVVL